MVRKWKSPGRRLEVLGPMVELDQVWRFFDKVCAVCECMEQKSCRVTIDHA